MGHVRIGHEDVVVADTGHAPAPTSPTIDRDEFTEDIPLADYQRRAFALQN